MKPFYSIHLYHDTDHEASLQTFDDALNLEHYCRRLYNQLRAMGARGEIRVYFYWRDNFQFNQKQVAFVDLNWYEFRYVGRN